MILVNSIYIKELRDKYGDEMTLKKLQHITLHNLTEKCPACKGTGIKQEETVTEKPKTDPKTTNPVTEKDINGKKDYSEIPDTNQKQVVDGFEGNIDGKFETPTDKIGADPKTAAEESPAEQEPAKEENKGDEEDPNNWFD